MRLLCQTGTEVNTNREGKIGFKKKNFLAQTHLDTENRQTMQSIKVLQPSDFIRAKEQTLHSSKRIQILNNLKFT